MSSGFVGIPGFRLTKSMSGENVGRCLGLVIRSNGRLFTVSGKLLTPPGTRSLADAPRDEGGLWVVRYVHVLVLEAFVGPRPFPRT